MFNVMLNRRLWKFSIHTFDLFSHLFCFGSSALCGTVVQDISIDKYWEKEWKFMTDMNDT